MKIKSINSIKNLIEELQKVDKEILDLNNLAKKISNGVKSVSLKFSIKEDKPKKLELDEDGSIIKRGYTSFDPGSIFRSIYLDFNTGKTGVELDHETSSMEVELNETNTLQIFHYLLMDKNYRRDQIIDKLKEKGFKE